MFKKTSIKTWLTACCCLIVVLSQAQTTGNPYWSFPPNYWNSAALYPLPNGSATSQYPNLNNPAVLGTINSYTNYASTNEDVAGPHNMYADASGNPLFSVVNGFVYNANGYAIDTLADTLTSLSNPPGGYWYDDTTDFKALKRSRQMTMGWSEATVVPVPGNCKQYYIFTSTDWSNDYTWFANSCLGASTRADGYRPCFALIDLSYQTPGDPTGGYGKNITSTLSFPGGNPSHIADLYKATSTGASSGRSLPCSPMIGNIHYTCTRLLGGSYRFLFVTNDNELIVYKITSTGITFVHNYDLTSLPSSATTYFGSVEGGGNIGEIECYVDKPDNIIKVAVLCQSQYNYSGVALAFTTFDTTAASMSTFSNVCCGHTGGNNVRVNGMEFSPDGNSVYVNGNTGLGAYSWNTLGSYAVGMGSSNPKDFIYSQMELGTDGSIYLIGQATYSSTPRLAKITSPNSVATATLTDNVANLTNYSYVTKGMYCPIGNTPYTDTVLYIPDQIDQDVYGSQFSANTACCLFYQAYDRMTYTAGISTDPTGWTSTVETWRANTVAGSYQKNPLTKTTSHTVTIGEELRIPAGVNITIDSMTIKFSPQARLIIENGTSSKGGGKLSLNNCTLTVDNRCITDLWPGVQVWGTPGSTQLTTYQGQFYTYNNTVIENAYVGVLAGYDTTWHSKITPRPSGYATLFAPNSNLSFTATTAPNSQHYTGGGGFIEITNSTLLNNQHHAIFNDYTTLTGNPNFQLYGSTFKTTSLLASLKPYYFVGIYNYNNNSHFPIEGCTFVDSTSDNYSDTGLYTLNAAYTVNYISGTGQRTYFSNFDYGIFAHDTTGSNTFSVENTTFLNNKYGIYAGTVNNTVIYADTFKIWQNPCVGHCAQPNAFGLYLDNCTGYQAENSNYTKYGSGTPTNNLYGIVANNSGQYVNAIYNNTYDHLYVGNQAQYLNYVYNGTGTHNPSGLIYVCNTFSPTTTKSADIYVPGYNSSLNVGSSSSYTTYSAGIQYAQGDGNSGYPSTGGNNFSHSTYAYDIYIDVSTDAYNSNYIYYCPSGTSTCTSTSYYPNPETWSGLSGAPGAYTVNVSCSSSPYSNGYRTSNPLQAMQSQADAYKATYDSLAELIDGGNTSSLMTLVSGSNNHQAVLNSLTQAAPYISNGVLTAYINSNYPAADIKQIVSACSPLTNDVKNVLNASNLSAGIKTQIAALQTGTCKIDSLTALMGGIFSSRHLLLNELVRTYISDTVQTTIQQGYTLMKAKAMELPARSQFETGLSLNDATMASNALAQIATAEGQSNYVQLGTILLQNINNPSMMQNSSVVSALQAMATDSSDRLVYYKVNTLLQSIGKSTYTPYTQPFPKLNAQANERTTQIAQVTAPVVLSASTLVNSPNPFKESTVVKAVIVEKTQNAYIVITDMVGNEIARYPVQQGENNINVNASGLDASVMFCTLIVDGVKIKTNKMVLIR